MNLDVSRARVLRFAGDTGEPVETADELAVEEPLEIRIAGEPFSVTMRTPGHDVQLTAGYLLSEGILRADSHERPMVRQEGPNVVNVAGLPGDPLPRRESLVAASCGLCGKGSIEQIHQRFPPLGDAADILVSTALLAGLPAALQSGQAGFVRTGGAHAAGLFGSTGEMIVVREDVGRHNAVDKVLGYAMLKRLLPLSRHVLLVSGRVSFEIVQKALGARIPVIAAVSAPSSLAVEFAEANGQTLIGFLRQGRCNVYSHPERVIRDTITGNANHQT